MQLLASASFKKKKYEILKKVAVFRDVTLTDWAYIKNPGIKPVQRGFARLQASTCIYILVQAIYVHPAMDAKACLSHTRVRACVREAFIRDKIYF